MLNFGTPSTASTCYSISVIMFIAKNKTYDIMKHSLIRLPLEHNFCMYLRDVLNGITQVKLGKILYFDT